MHLCDVRERLPACCTLAQVLHSLVIGKGIFFFGIPPVFREGVRDDFEFEFEFKRVVNPIFKFIFKLEFELEF